MGKKRILFAAFVVVAVLALTILLLFQSGVDEKVIDSLMPKVEKKLGVKITYENVDASLTSLVLNEVEVRDGENGCVLAAVNRLGVGFRVGPLFFGEVDLTGIRLDGLSIRLGESVSGCAPSRWREKAGTLIHADDASKKSDGMGIERPEVYVASGQVLYDDNRFRIAFEKLSGRIGDKNKAAFEIERYSMKGADAIEIEGDGINVLFEPDAGRIRVQTNGTEIHVKNPTRLAVPLFRDFKETLREWGGKEFAAVEGEAAAPQDGGPTDLPAERMKIALPVDLSLAVNDARLVVKNEADASSWTANTLSVELALGKEGDLSVRSAGRLPGTDARFNLNIKKTPDRPVDIYLKVPDMSLAELGIVMFPSDHLDWKAASLDGELHLLLDMDSLDAELEGRAVLTNLTVGHPRIAPEPIYDFGFNTEFKLHYHRAESKMNIERLLISRDLFRMTLRGDVRFDRLAVDLYLNVPVTPCRQIAAAVPEPLRPKLKNAVFDGSLAADLHLAMDKVAPETTALDVNLNNQCRIASFGDIPEPNYFRGPFSYTAYTETDAPLRLVTGFGTDRWTPYAALSPFLIEAVLTTEDGKFWSHTGITLPEVRRAIELNLKADAMSHGASTITMQLAKNLFLTRDRTVARKLQELVFVWYLESYFSKEELLELYFNIVEFGPSIYGISDAAMYYFGREPAELNALESVFLIKLLPNPVSRHKTYERGAASQKLISQLHRVLRTMRERNRLTDAELTEALSEQLVFHKEGTALPEPRQQPNHRLKGRGYTDETYTEGVEDETGAF